MPSLSSQPVWDRARAQKALRTWTGLFPLCKPVRYDAGSEIFTQGDEAKDLFLLAEGLVVLTADLPSGAESVLGLRFAGQVIDLCTSALHVRYSFSARTVSPCILYRTDARALHEREQRDPDVARLILEFLRYDLHSAATFIMDLKTLPPDQRIQRFLHFVATALGLRPVRNTLQIPMPLRDEQVASLVGVSSRQFKRIKKRMCESGRLSIHRPDKLTHPRFIGLLVFPPQDAVSHSEFVTRLHR